MTELSPGSAQRMSTYQKQTAPDIETLQHIDNLIMLEALSFGSHYVGSADAVQNNDKNVPAMHCCAVSQQFQKAQNQKMY